MSPLDSFWNGVLSLLTPLVTPDWGKLVVLIPWLLLLLVVAFLALVGRAWWRLFRSEPVRGPKVRRRPLRPMVIGHAAVVGIGVVTVILAFIGGAQEPDWTGAQSPLGLVVNFPLLILGLAVALGATGNAARLWERNGRDDVEPDVLDDITAAIRRHPARARRVVVFIAGVLIAATGIALGAVPGVSLTAARDAAAQGTWPHDVAAEPVPIAVFPVLVIGLALAVGAVGSGIAALWHHGEEVQDTPPGDESVALVPLEH